MWSASGIVLVLLAVQWSGVRVGAQAPSPTQSQLTVFQRAQLMNAHNAIRSDVTPPAADMMKLKWNDALASVAQDHANRCTWHYNDERTMASRHLGLQYAYVGENVFISAAELDMALERAMASWVGEEVNYNRTTNKCRPNQLCSHYKQIVWSKTQEIGCGVSQCASVQGLPTWQHTSTVLVCNYAVGGLMPPNAVPYTRGEKCTLCPDIAPYCENNALCTSGIPATTAPTQPPTVVATPEPATQVAPTAPSRGSAAHAAPSVAPSLLPSKRLGPRYPIPAQTRTQTPVPALPVVPSAVFMVEFERRFQKLEAEVQGLETKNAELKQGLQSQVQSYSSFKIQTERVIASLSGKSANKHSRASAHLETPSSGVLTMLPGSVITRFDLNSNESSLIGGFATTPTAALIVPETGNYFVYAQLTSMQWGPSSIHITSNNRVIGSASSSYGFQESAYVGKFASLKKGDLLRLKLGKGSKLYRSNPGSTYMGAFLL